MMRNLNHIFIYIQVYYTNIEIHIFLVYYYIIAFVLVISYYLNKKIKYFSTITYVFYKLNILYLNFKHTYFVTTIKYENTKNIL